MLVGFQISNTPDERGTSQIPCRNGQIFALAFCHTTIYVSMDRFLQLDTAPTCLLFDGVGVWQPGCNRSPPRTQAKIPRVVTYLYVINRWHPHGFVPLR